ncbi:phosphatidylglycerol:prolipoprotein diacylglycerol transferase [Alkalibacterium subtropicum]|uniref:Phosphatidylglycerol--prolipoprotein diacylglyceryl transferase n=1 Tax=Alkalibacterium subtropicum TaxID=753702 RepID=A0A1I1FTZ6_9LACT|nr:prolipoprotein diacylglyceryl transferase [Alkalibacterium subtropicum]SFC02775.1 phosphatidylglycerol:prolipoprotein diacylglycerol transferase [Alkalibacterium subtropicum]
MVELFNIGHYGINLLGVTTALGMLIGLLLVQKEGKRKRLDEDTIMNLSIYTVLLGILGARLGYIIFFDPSKYLENPVEIFNITQGGLSIQGAIIVAGIFVFWYTKKKNLPLGKTADTIVPGVILGQAIGRVGCDVFGIPMKGNWPWGVMVRGELMHPAQLYEVALNLILFLIIWKRRYTAKFEGELFYIYIIGFAVNRFIVEFFRTNPQAVGPFSIAHVLSLAIIAAGILSLIYNRNKNDDFHVSDNIEEVSLSGSWVYGVIAGTFVLAVIFYYGIHFFYSR